MRWSWSNGHHDHVACLLACGAYGRYDFDDDHPLKSRRLDIGLDLLRAT